MVLRCAGDFVDLPTAEEAGTREGRPAPETPDARPVAVGEADLCAMLRYMVQDSKAALEQELAPQQGGGRSREGGITILVHGTRVLLEANSTWVIVTRSICGTRSTRCSER